MFMNRKKEENVKKNIGSTLDSWLREEGLCEKVSGTALERVVARRARADAEELKRMNRVADQLDCEVADVLEYQAADDQVVVKFCGTRQESSRASLDGQPRAAVPTWHSRRHWLALTPYTRQSTYTLTSRRYLLSHRPRRFFATLRMVLRMAASAPGSLHYRGRVLL